MSDEKLYIVLMGLPARGKSTLAARLRDAFRRDGIPTRIFNNGNLRRLYRSFSETAISEFYSPENSAAVKLREGFARMNVERAKTYLQNSGQVAINATSPRLYAAASDELCCQDRARYQLHHLRQLRNPAQARAADGHH